MKAIIMAGGDGMRLRPMSMLRPKPMVRLFDKPALEYIIRLLRRHGISDICITLRYLPQTVTDYFGDGGDFGVCLDYRIETEPLGTAGGVRACSDFLGGEDFLVISGDAVCDFDLGKCVDFHMKKNAEATLVLCRSDKPLEYGLVMTDETGRITQFIEKPSWDRVFTDSVNTGIYILSGKTLERIPKNTFFDFSRDLFPAMLSGGAPLYGKVSEGYWCDIGSAGAYLGCIGDALRGDADIGLPKADPTGNRVFSVLPATVRLKAPCWIGAGAQIGENAEIGPFTVIGAGSSIGAGARIKGSVIDTAVIGARSELGGAIICNNARIGAESIVSEGAVIGDGAVIGSGSYVAEDVRVWPNKSVRDGSRLFSSIVRGSGAPSPLFGGGRVIGEINLDLSLENCLNLGAALACYDKIILGSSGGPAASAAADALRAGICAGGGEVWSTETSFESAAAFAPRYYAMGASAFVRQDNANLIVSLFDSHGSPFNRSAERKLESALSGDTLRVPYVRIGRVRFLPDILDAYVLEAVKNAYFREKIACSTPVFVEGENFSSFTLKRALAFLGCPTAHSRNDGLCFHISEDGFSLVTEYDGLTLFPQQLKIALAMMEFESGSGRLALSGPIPAAIELLAANLSGKILRTGKDAEAEELMDSQAYMNDGIFAAARLCTGLALRGETPDALVRRAPKFFSASVTVTVNGSKGALMRRLAGRLSEMSLELTDGLLLRTGDGNIRVSPLSDAALRISVESEKADFAEELCTRYSEIIAELDADKKDT